MRPDGCRAGHREHPGALGGRSRLGADGVPDGCHPHTLDVGEQRVWGELVTQRVERECEWTRT